MARAPLSPAERRRWQRIGALAALSLMLGYLETFVPIPLPGVKLGLANIPILVCLADGDATGALFVALVKVVASGLLFGNPLSMAYSLVGTTLSLALMLPLSRLRTMRLEMVSIVGALAHEAGQLLVAQVVLGTPLVWYSAPVLGVAGCATGLLSGVVARKTAEVAAHGTPDAEEAPTCAADRVDAQSDDLGASDAPSVPIGDHNSAKHAPLAAHAGPVLVAYVCLVVAALRVRDPYPIAVTAACAVCAALLARVSLRTLRAALMPLVPLALLTLVMQVFVAHETLAASLVMLVRILTITLASLAVVELVGRESLARCARMSLAPLRVLGLRTEGPELALATALQLLPLLVSSVGSELHFHDVWTSDFWLRRLPTTIAGLYERADCAG